MLDATATARTLWDAHLAGAPLPDALTAELTGDALCAVQLAVLSLRKAESGLQQSGWKIGQTSAAMRAQSGETAPAFGYLQASTAWRSGHRLALGGADDWCLEPELAFVLGAEVRGPGVTPAQVRDAVAAVAPAFEVVRTRTGYSDRAVVRALNLNNDGYVLGPRVDGCPDADALDALRVCLRCNGAERLQVRGGDVNDNPLECTAWLANRLAPWGHSLGAGQVILTGSYSPLLPVAAGEHWEATLDALGTVVTDCC